MKTLLLLFFTTLGLCARSQFAISRQYMTGHPIVTSRIDTGGIYLFTEHDYSTNEPSIATYYRKYDLESTEPYLFRIKEYWMSGVLKAEYYRTGDDIGRLTKEFKTYDRSGKLLSQLEFIKPGYNIAIYGYQVTKYYSALGTKKMEYNDDGIFNSWDSSGVREIDQGEGYFSYATYLLDTNKVIIASGKVRHSKLDSVWIGRYADGKIAFRERYNKGIFKDGISYDSIGHEYSYRNVQNDERARESLSAYIKGVISLLPFRARRFAPYYDGYDVPQFTNDTAAIFRMEIAIDPNGIVTSTLVLQSVNDKIDDFILKAVRKAPQIEPKYIRGQKDNWIFEMALEIPYN